MTNGGVETDLSGRRSVIQVTTSITIPAGDCQVENRYLGIQLLGSSGQLDAYTDNDYIAVELPPMNCDSGGK